MPKPLLIAILITSLMVAAHVGIFWWFVFRENKKSRTPGKDDSEGDGNSN